MKKIAVIAILLLLVFIIGCGKSDTSLVKSAASDSSDTAAKTAYKETGTSGSDSGTTSSGSRQTTSEGRELTGETRTTQESSTGETVTFRKLEDNTRQKETAEKCDMADPLECVEYMASNGIIYLSIKNKAYDSKLDKVTLSLNDDECDPKNTFIETGQIKEFECFDDRSLVTGTLVMKYYKPMAGEGENQMRTGSLVVKME